MHFPSGFFADQVGTNCLLEKSMVYLNSTRAGGKSFPLWLSRLLNQLFTTCTDPQQSITGHSILSLHLKATWQLQQRRKKSQMVSKRPLSLRVRRKLPEYEDTVLTCTPQLRSNRQTWSVPPFRSSWPPQVPRLEDSSEKSKVHPNDPALPERRNATTSRRSRL